MNGWMDGWMDGWMRESIEMSVCVDRIEGESIK